MAHSLDTSDTSRASLCWAILTGFWVNVMIEAGCTQVSQVRLCRLQYSQVHERIQLFWLGARLQRSNEWQHQRRATVCKWKIEKNKTKNTAKNIVSSTVSLPICGTKKQQFVNRNAKSLPFANKNFCSHCRRSANGFRSFSKIRKILNCVSSTGVALVEHFIYC